jgi:methyl-accepting chemotaxis protein
MAWLGAHKVRLTIIVGFCLISVLSLGSVCFVLNSLYLAKDSSEKLFSSSLIPASLSEQLVTKTYELENVRRIESGPTLSEDLKEETLYYVNEIHNNYDLLIEKDNNFKNKNDNFLITLGLIEEVLSKETLGKGDSIVLAELFEKLDIGTFRNQISEHVEYLKGIGLTERSNIQGITKQSIKVSIILVSILFGIALIILFVLFKEVIFKISDMRNICEEITNGNLEERLPKYPGNSELILLASSYNNMLDSMISSRGKLDGIFKSIKEYLIVFSEDGEIFMANNYFYQNSYYSPSEIEGKPISTIIGEELYSKCLKGITNVETTLTIKNGSNRTIDLSCVSIE